MAPRGIPADRLAKLRSAMTKLQSHKTYKRLIKAIGEVTDYETGPAYEAQRPAQSKAYKAMIAGLMKK
jgi:tripartite-type tricarboxylate transporter receptor subunit TctC